MPFSRKTVGLMMAGLVLAALLTLAWRPRAEPLGAKLAAALERDGLPLRTAVMLVDYAPDAADLARSADEPLRSGLGLGPGVGGLGSLGTDRRWIAGGDFGFSWKTGAGGGGSM